MHIQTLDELWACKSDEEVKAIFKRTSPMIPRAGGYRAVSEDGDSYESAMILMNRNLGEWHRQSNTKPFHRHWFRLFEERLSKGC